MKYYAGVNDQEENEREGLKEPSKIPDDDDREESEEDDDTEDDDEFDDDDAEDLDE